MSIDDFLKEIEQIREFYGVTFVLEGSYITSRPEEFCPIKEVALRQDNFIEVAGVYVLEVARQLGLHPQSARAIALAADGKRTGKLRQRLLKACGLPT